MKKNILVFLAIALSGCAMDVHIGICILKNNTQNDIVAACWDSSPMQDSLLYNDRVYMPNYIKAGAAQSIGGPYNHVDVDNDPDSVKAYVYVFSPDSLDKYRKLLNRKGILKQSLLKKIEIQVNKIKEPLDTISVN